MSLSITQQINEFKSKKEILMNNVKEFITDTDYPLNARWDTFGDASGAGLFETKYPYLEFHILGEKNLEWDSDLYVERYSTFYLQNLIDYTEDNKWSIKDTNRLKEEILACGYDSFVYDW